MVRCLNFGKYLQGPNCTLNKVFRYQLLATLTVNIIAFSHGIGIGWLSPTLVKLQSPESPLHFYITTIEASWIGSLIGLGSLLGNITFGFLIEMLCRKACLYLIAIPHIFLWILIYFAQSVEYLYVARLLGGFTGGSIYVILPLFISEIADLSIRGTLSTILMLSVNIGILTGFILSTHIDYFLMPCIIVLLPMTYLLGIKFLPESPHYLLRKGANESALRSFKFYKNYSEKGSTDDFQKCNEQFEQIKNFMTAKKQSSTKLSYYDIINKQNLLIFLTAFIILIANQFSGLFAFVNYMSNIFILSGSPIDTNSSTIVMGVIQILGVYAATIFVDHLGRKTLLLISTGGYTLGVTSFGCYIHFLKEEYSWIPIFIMAFVVFIGNMGLVALIFVIIVEIFPSKIRSLATSISMSVLSVLVFIILKVFPIYMEMFGISITMWTCGLVTGTSFIYLIFFLPETKGKPMEE